MKCTVFFLVIFYCIFQFGSFADAAVAFAEPNPLRKPGGCYEENVGHLKAGVKITVPGQCASAECNSDGSIYYAGCGTVDTNVRACYIRPVDLSKPHPECCPDIICTPSFEGPSAITRQ